MYAKVQSGFSDIWWSGCILQSVEYPSAFSGCKVHEKPTFLGDYTLIKHNSEYYLPFSVNRSLKICHVGPLTKRKTNENQRGMAADVTS